MHGRVGRPLPCRNAPSHALRLRPKLGQPLRGVPLSQPVSNFTQNSTGLAQGRERMAQDPNRILLVEDQAGTRDGLAEALALAGYLVDRFDAGGRALEYLSTGPKPDLILLDLFLHTDMDGWQFAERVKASPRAAGIPIVAMTGAKLGDEERERVQFDAFFFKPLDLRSLLHKIEQLLEARGRRTGGGTASFPVKASA